MGGRGVKEERRREIRDLLVLIDHIRNPPAFIHYLAPAIAVEELTAQLTGTQEPRSAVAIRAVLEQLRQLFPFFETLLQSKQVSVHAAAVAGVGDIPHVRVNSGPETLHALFRRNGRVSHGGAEGYGLVANGSAGLRTALLEATRCGGLVRGAVDAVHLVVGELNDHLHIGIWGCFELLDQAFAIALVGLHAEFMLRDESVKVGDSAVDVFLHGGIEVEFNRRWLGKVGAYAGIAKVELVGEDEHVNVIVQTMSRGAIHHGMFADEARSAIIVDDELYGFVEESVLAVAMPVLMGSFFERDWGRIVKTYDERRGLDCFKGRSIGGMSGQEVFACRVPEISILGSEGTNRRGTALCECINAAKLLLQLCSCELLAADCIWDFEELILAHDKNVRIIGMGIFDRTINVFAGNPACVEHPLIGFHADWQLLHILWLE